MTLLISQVLSLYIFILLLLTRLSSLVRTVKVQIRKILFPQRHNIQILHILMVMLTKLNLLVVKLCSQFKNYWMNHLFPQSLFFKVTTVPGSSKVKIALAFLMLIICLGITTRSMQVLARLIPFASFSMSISMRNIPCMTILVIDLLMQMYTILSCNQLHVIIGTNKVKTKPVVLIHGMFMNSLCWENWIPRYQAKGYRALAPAWPGRDKTIEALRKNHPDSKLAKLKLNDVVRYMAEYIQGLDEKPAIIGHSMGGL